MKRFQLPIIGLLAAGVAMGCKSKSEAGAAAIADTASDSLYHLAIGFHDEAMPRMGQLMGYQKRVRALIDSSDLAEATRSASATGSVPPEVLQRLNQQLEHAIYAMNDWMDHFDPDPTLENQQALTAYFEQQATSARNMRDSVFAALDSVARYLPADSSAKK